MNRRRQLQSLKKLSALEVGTYLPASECVGKEFADGQYLYRVVQYHPRKASFTLEMVNAFNQRIEKPEAFVRHHCTPPAPREITPCRYERPIYPQFPRNSSPSLLAGKGTGEGVRDNVQNPADNISISDVRHFAPSRSDKTEFDGMPTVQTNTLEMSPEVVTCPDVHFNTTVAGTAVTLLTSTTPLSASEAQGRGAGGEVDPAFYLDQEFNWSFQDSHFTFRVQKYNAERKAFLLYPVGGCTGGFYRDAAFVYEHCVPAAAPVSREPLPTIEFNPYRFWNLVSLTDKRQYIANRVQATGTPQPDPLLQCACCGQHVTIIGKQTWSPKMNRKDSILVECRNEDCIAQRRTATTDSHHQICADARKELRS